MAIQFRPFRFIAPKNFKLFGFLIFRFWTYLMTKTLKILKEVQTTQWSKEKVQKDKQRSTNYTHKTKWRLFQKRVVRIKFDFYVFIITIHHWVLIRYFCFWLAQTYKKAITLHSRHDVEKILYKNVSPRFILFSDSRNR